MKIILYIFFLYISVLQNSILAIENKILLKVDNEIITSVDILDEIKYCDSGDFENCVEVQTNVVTIPISVAIPFINNKIDIRDKKTILDNDIIHILDKKDTNFYLLLEENKKAILKEIYNDIKETLIV